MGWGLEITSDAIRLCRAGFRHGRVEIQRLGEVPVAHGMIRPSLKEGNLPNPGALADTLRQQVRRLGCRGWVRLVLPDSLFLLRTVATDDLPKDRAAARKFLSWQVRDLLPFPAEEARLDFLPSVPGTDGRLRVTCLVARTRVMMEYEALMEKVGLRAAVLDAHSVTLAQSASTFLAKKTAGLLSAEGERATLLVVQEGRPRLWRILSLDPASGDNGVRLIREVADSLAFFQESESVGPLERLLVHGMQPWAAETAAALADWLEIPVSVLDVGGIVPPSEMAGDDAAGDLSRWGAAVGAAIRPC